LWIIVVAVNGEDGDTDIQVEVFVVDCRETTSVSWDAIEERG
jgi:hypothetical protein